MKTKRPRWADSYRSLFFFSVLAIASGVALAQGDPSEPPTNGHAKRFGGGWECDPGYEKADQSCVAIQVPPTFLDYPGDRWDRWECNRGYRQVNDACALVDVPLNAFLDSRGNGWDCD